jgi:hypothetical protein
MSNECEQDDEILNLINELKDIGGLFLVQNALYDIFLKMRSIFELDDMESSWTKNSATLDMTISFSFKKLSPSNRQKMIEILKKHTNKLQH